MTKKLVVSASLLAKSQVAAYTRKDGTVVQAHDNGRQAAAPKKLGVGSTVKVTGKTTKEGGVGQIKQSQGEHHIVKFQDGSSYLYHHSDLSAHADAEQASAKPLPSHVQKMVSDVAQSPAKPEHKKAAIDAIVSQHAGGAAAPKPAAGGGGYSVAAFKHGGHQIKEPDGTHHVILQDKGVADRHAGALNHVATSGKDAHMNEAVHAAAKKHLHLDSFDEVGRDSEDFVDTGKGGLKAALHHAYDAGAGHSKGGTHRDTVVAEAAKHFAGFDSLEQEGRDHLDFKETSKGLLKHALKHAYASGAQKAQAKPKLKVKASLAPAHTPDPHHSDLEEGDELLDEKGQKHEYSATHRGIGRMQVAMRSGHKVPTGSDGKLAGWKKTGRNNITGAGHDPHPASAKTSSAAPQKAAAAAPGPMTPDAVQEHALQSGAKSKSNVAVFSRPESAHSFAEKAATSKGGAFVMKHPNHAHHVVVNGADSQRMSKNGYEYVRPVMKGRGY